MIPKPELITIAVAEAGGTSESVDTEDVAMAAHRLAPGAFRWRKFPDQINLELVRVALVDAGRTKGGGLVQGSGKSGWVLTDAGVRWMATTGERLRVQLTEDETASRVRKPEPRAQAHQRSRLVRSKVFAAWTAGRAISPVGAASVFRVDQYTPDQTRLLKIRKLQSLFAGDPELDEFLRDMGYIAAQRSGGGKSGE